jgi:hypothetical protein
MRYLLFVILVSCGGGGLSTSNEDLSRAGNCHDQMQNGDETDVDCGGSCSPCAAGSACVHKDDCMSMQCSNNICAAASDLAAPLDLASPMTADLAGPPDLSMQTIYDLYQPVYDLAYLADLAQPIVYDLAYSADLAQPIFYDFALPPADLAMATCTDHVRDGTETDVDCGGSCPNACANGQGCLHASDCISKYCLNNVCVLQPSDGAMSTGFAPPIIYGASGTTEGLAAGDFDHDGKIDLAASFYTTAPNTNGLSVLLGRGDGTFPGPVNTLVSGVSYLSSADLNGDLRDDLVTDGYNNVAVYLSTGGGAFQGSMTYTQSGSDLYEGTPPMVIDLNGDLIADVVVDSTLNGGTTPPMVASWLTGSMGVLQPKGTFAFASVGCNIQGPLAAGDFNGDKKPDVISLCRASSGSTFDTLSIRLSLGNGDGTFQTPTSDVATSSTQFGGIGALLAADLNGDKKTDLVVGANTAEVFLGNGDGTFAPYKSYAAGYAASFAAADFNGDGAIDLACSLNQAQSIVVLYGKGDGSFPISENFLVGGMPYQLVARDLNADGKPDLAVANGSGVVVMLTQ